MLERKNYFHNKQIDLEGKLVNGQGRGRVSTMRYGLFPMSYNGCEMIALYNMLLLKGYKDANLPEICLEMYPKAWALWGIFGSNVYVLDHYFKPRGIPCTKTLSRDKFFETLKKDRVGVISFWNAHHPFDGIHTVCVEYTGDGYRVYNRYNSKRYPYEYKTVDEVVDKPRFMCGYTIPDFDPEN